MYSYTAIGRWCWKMAGGRWVWQVAGGGGPLCSAPAWGYDTPRGPRSLDHDAQVLQGIVGRVGVGLVHHRPCALAHSDGHRGQLH